MAAGGAGGNSGKTYSFKVVLLGEGCVGKTSLVLRYCENKFNDKHITTLQASFLTKKLNITGKRVNLAIWDTAGQERFHALGPIYYRDSNGAILVYDITDEDSFQKVKNWVKELRKMLGNEICLCIVGKLSHILQFIMSVVHMGFRPSLFVLHVSIFASLLVFVCTAAQHEVVSLCHDRTFVSRSNWIMLLMFAHHEFGPAAVTQSAVWQCCFH
ncbi:ras-related protein Rab-21 isoform X2 [Hippoglossus hippoglossus]|uniref:ras-related protein Rab-21 isoform X2 n=1 Tax=Hippoglossus hippoglossus TaxID=8267 RepID=UPI00148C6AF8|nr:ras-related protein Rab-21 isoform X2 [Hippoglossus hippoglossus]